MQKKGLNGDGKSAVATFDGRMLREYLGFTVPSQRGRNAVYV